MLYSSVREIPDYSTCNSKTWLHCHYNILNIGFICEFKRRDLGHCEKIAFQQILFRAGVFWQCNVVLKLNLFCGIFPKLYRILPYQIRKVKNLFVKFYENLSQKLFKKYNFRVRNVVVDSILPLKSDLGWVIQVKLLINM